MCWSFLLRHEDLSYTCSQSVTYTLSSASPVGVRGVPHFTQLMWAICDSSVLTLSHNPTHIPMAKSEAGNEHSLMKQKSPSFFGVLQVEEGPIGKLILIYFLLVSVSASGYSCAPQWPTETQQWCRIIHNWCHMVATIPKWGLGTDSRSSARAAF